MREYGKAQFKSDDGSSGTQNILDKRNYITTRLIFQVPSKRFVDNNRVTFQIHVSTYVSISFLASIRVNNYPCIFNYLSLLYNYITIRLRLQLIRTSGHFLSCHHNLEMSSNFPLKNRTEWSTTRLFYLLNLI